MDLIVKRQLLRPRMAVIGFDEDEAARIGALAASPIIADRAAKLARPWDEIDVAVVNGDPGPVPWDMSTLRRVVDVGLADTRSEDPYMRAPGVRAGWTDAVEIAIPRSLPEGLAVAAEQLVASYPDDGQQMYFWLNRIDDPRAFLTNPRGELLAGEYERGAGIGWILPPYAKDLRGWVRLFLQRVHDLDPLRVPLRPPNWEPWRTAREIELMATRATIQQERDVAAGAFERRLAELDEAVDAAGLEREAGLGLLLTAEGDLLKTAVLDAVRVIGFDVVDADGQLSPGEGRREDLWVRELGGEETVIVEVKGYAKGARSGDLVAAAHYSRFYLERHGEAPRGQWHIVNANRHQDPDARPRLFQGADDVVSGFDGLVIDTRDLFRLVRDIELGKVPEDRGREILWEAEPGHFLYRPA